MKTFVTQSITSLKTSGKDLIKEIQKVLLNDNENIIDDVKLLKGYTHQVLWFLLSYVAVEEYIIICNWLCKLTRYLDKVADAIRNMNCRHLSGTANNDDCICRILYEIICLLVKSIKRLHEHKREIILRKNEPTAADCKCTCECCTQKGEAGTTCTCVDKTKIKKKEDEFFTVSTKSLDNIRSTILIFYGMEKIIGKYKELGCNNGSENECACKEKPDKYTECLSLFSVCYSILVDLSSMKDDTLLTAVTWLSNCLKFVCEQETKKCEVKVFDTKYETRNKNYVCRSKENKDQVDKVAGKYTDMIKEAEKLSGVTDNINNAGSCKTIATACTTTPECSSTETCSGEKCNCSSDCGCPPPTPSNDNVFKDLCGIMCCNGSGNCNCNTGGKNCQSIKTFCKEVNNFIALVDSVKKNATTTSAESTPPPTCNCNDKNCDYCKTRRFIKFVEAYTKKLNEEHECECKDFVDKIFGQLSIIIKTPFRFFGMDWVCPCCGYDYQNCLKDGEHCGISNIMKDWFCLKGPRLIYGNFNI